MDAPHAKGWCGDVFYVVYNPATDVLKFGITSGDPRPRLGYHRRDGYTEVLRTFTALPNGEARALEGELKTLMRCAGVAPIINRLEYFPGAARNAVLGTVDAWFPGRLTVPLCARPGTRTEGLPG